MLCREKSGTQSGRLEVCGEAVMECRGIEQVQSRRGSAGQKQGGQSGKERKRGAALVVGVSE